MQCNAPVTKKDGKRVTLKHCWNGCQGRRRTNKDREQMHFIAIQNDEKGNTLELRWIRVCVGDIELLRERCLKKMMYLDDALKG